MENPHKEDINGNFSRCRELAGYTYHQVLAILKNGGRSVFNVKEVKDANFPGTRIINLRLYLRDEANGAFQPSYLPLFCKIIEDMQNGKLYVDAEWIDGYPDNFPALEKLLKDNSSDYIDVREFAAKIMKLKASGDIKRIQKLVTTWVVRVFDPHIHRNQVAEILEHLSAAGFGAESSMTMIKETLKRDCVSFGEFLETMMRAKYSRKQLVKGLEIVIGEGHDSDRYVFNQLRRHFSLAETEKMLEESGWKKARIEAAIGK